MARIRKAASPARTGTEPTVEPAADRHRAKIRMYCHGLGDCFLVTLPRDTPVDGREQAFILIDCGLILGTGDAKAKMREVVANIAETTGGFIDLLVVTHEHWDHVSGFAQAQTEFKSITFGSVWFGWTENPDDEKAQALVTRRSAAIKALVDSGVRMRGFGVDAAADTVNTFLGFFGEDIDTEERLGAAGTHSTRSALEIARGFVKTPRYCKPTEPPGRIAGTGARLYVLGPPEDETLLRTSLPSKRDPETYGMDGTDAWAALFLKELEGDPDSQSAPFGQQSAIPMDVARTVPFFSDRYWGGGEDGGAWRRIDGDWLAASTELALRLDNDTNNTSLVLAIELDGGDVLLFAADAQVGNWLSWQDLKWTVDGRTVTGPDLLKRTVFYKVGHHGSHNATLRQKGLELMDKLQLAMIPVDQEMARKKKWDHMPLPELVEALTARTGGYLVRSDGPPPAALGAVLEEGHTASSEKRRLYYEYTL
ncbi:hypothetical protein [Roseomonas genomospecies 6]|uniref:Uncharacterized protein n=1 Tax=Roseomonas genomospecies 6 TaxID=214106 RepID=A0A9W7KQZ7_9PROT|nr:hypothetical protein [Roseomonas genomospecies 6]KAA0677942.1 hypothetical protein DS843_21650 [Roseomonas genomospecies 6]